MRKNFSNLYDSTGSSVLDRLAGKPFKKICKLVTQFYHMEGAIVAMIVWYLDLQLPMQSVPITTDVVSLNLDQGNVYNIM
jgi:hypothetical protein